MSIVHWELFRMCPLNKLFDGLHELPYQKELGTEKATIDKLQAIVSKGNVMKLIFFQVFLMETFFKMNYQN